MTSLYTATRVSNPSSSSIIYGPTHRHSSLTGRTVHLHVQSGQSPPVSTLEMAIQQAQLFPGLDTCYLCVQTIYVIRWYTAARILKSTASVIAPSLKTLFNYSVMNGVVPDEWKNSNIVPLPKSSNRAQASNYRFSLL